MYKGLLVRPRPIDDETPGSLLMRAAYENGFATINQMTHVSGFDFLKQSYQAALIKVSKYKQILKVLNLKLIDVAKTMGRAGLSSRSGRQLGNTSFPDAYFREDCTAYCPSCLTEKSYWRRMWLFKPYISCHKHGCVLVDKCSSCNKSLVITRGCIYKCSYCQFDLRETKPEIEDISTSQWLHDVIEGDEKLDAQVFTSVYDAIRLFANNTKIENSYCFAGKLAHLHFTNRGAAIDAMISRIKENDTHPRLQLLPLLSSDGHSNTFANEILKFIDIPLTQLSPRDEEVRVSLGEAIALLETSANTLRKWVTKCINQGVEVEFPIMVKLLLNIKSQFEHDRKNESQIALSHDTLTVNQAAEQLIVHPEIVRAIQHKGFLKFEKKNVEGSLKAVTSKTELEDFNSQYVLVGTLARKLGVNATDLSAKLRSLGINPIAGPKIDGLKTNLFKLQDVKNLTKDLLNGIEKCESNAGRKKVTDRSLADITTNRSSITLVEVSTDLKISIQKVKTLVQKGLLTRAEISHDGVAVTKQSLAVLKKNIANTEYMSTKEACTELDISPLLLSRDWVNTGFINVIDCHYWKLVSKKQVADVLKIKKEYVDAAEGGRLIGVHRAHLINQERIGKINCREFAGKKLFKISDVRALSVENIASLI